MRKAKTVGIFLGAVLALDVAVAFLPAVAVDDSSFLPFFMGRWQTPKGTFAADPAPPNVRPAESATATLRTRSSAANAPPANRSAASTTPADTPGSVSPHAAAAKAGSLPADAALATAKALGKVDDVAITAAIPPEPPVPPDSVSTPAEDIGPLTAALDALYAGDLLDARIYREKLPEGSLDRDILTWAIAMSGDPQVSSGEIAAASRMLATWPGDDTLRINAERALYREKPDPQAVIRAFGGTAPKTVQGAKLLARADIAIGNTDAARALLSNLWRTERMEAADEAAILKEFGELISPADHRFRMERMFYAEQPGSALRLAELAQAKELAAAWAAVLRKDKAAGKLLDAVPPAQRSAGYLFARAQYLHRRKDLLGAAAVMAKAPRDGAQLVDPDAWWVERRILSRDLVDHGDIRTAYQVVAAHSAEKPDNIIDAEFHAGWYALRGLNDAKTAVRHFARIAGVASGPIGSSRAYYWLGRAVEANGGNGSAYYKIAARYGTAFYGQLAADRLGMKAIAIDYPSPSDADRKTFAEREPVQAIARLEQAGYPSRANILYLDLAGALDSPGELALLAALAEKRGDHFLALRIGKVAAARGLAIGALSHPVGVIPASADISGAGQALAYAIARQESEFNVAAVSGAGARGLLQLLPGTAKDMAKQNGLPYSLDRLTADAGYNATLGAAFLSEQLDRFDGSYVLTFAGYNAGPRRAREWIAKYGDPRGRKLDQVVDWIERIPYTETRNYVQRVMENYEVYRMRLSGRFDIAGDLVSGR
jgi:soluble lytic murein transglycosylase